MEASMKRAAFAGMIAALVLLPSSGANAASSRDRMKDCARQWDAMREAGRTKDVRYRDFQRTCLSAAPEAVTPREAERAPARVPDQRTTTAPRAPEQRNTTAPRTPERRITTGARTEEPGQFENESAAKLHCAGDTVVWVNTSSRVYHFSGHRNYGTTKRGAYMCQQASERAGFRAAKNEKAGR
jgi:hypothetical protein